MFVEAAAPFLLDRGRCDESVGAHASSAGTMVSFDKDWLWLVVR